MKQVALLLAMLMVGSISAQSQKLTIDVKSCYKFDIETFEKNADHYKRYEFYLKDGLKVTQIKSNAIVYTGEETTKMRISYEETIELEGTPLKKCRVYEATTGSIISEWDLFYSCPVGKNKQFDEFGILYSETDAEANMPFKLSDVIKMVKKDFGVDLTKPRYFMSVSRGSDYSVSFGSDTLFPYNPFKGEWVQIDGITGDICLHVKDWQILIDTNNQYPDGLPIIL